MCRGSNGRRQEKIAKNAVDGNRSLPTGIGGFQLNEQKSGFIRKNFTISGISSLPSGIAESTSWAFHGHGGQDVRAPLRKALLSIQFTGGTAN